MEATATAAAILPAAPSSRRLLLPLACPSLAVGGSSRTWPQQRLRIPVAAVRALESGAIPSANYVVPLDKKPSPLIRPLAEILRDLNKRVSDKIINPDDNSIPWFHANRMLSFYAPGWCGEVRDVIFSNNGNVTVVYRVTIRGVDGEAHRDSTGTVSLNDNHPEGHVAAAEQLAFCRACARFGLGLYLYHEDETS